MVVLQNVLHLHMYVAQYHYEEVNELQYPLYDVQFSLVDELKLSHWLKTYQIMIFLWFQLKALLYCYQHRASGTAQWAQEYQTYVQLPRKRYIPDFNQLINY